MDPLPVGPLGSWRIVEEAHDLVNLFAQRRFRVDHPGLQRCPISTKPTGMPSIAHVHSGRLAHDAEACPSPQLGSAAKIASTVLSESPEKPRGVCCRDMAQYPTNHFSNCLADNLFENLSSVVILISRQHLAMPVVAAP